jgi:Putative transposase/Transposase zinc-binding domain
VPQQLLNKIGGIVSPLIYSRPAPISTPFRSC